MGEQGLTSQPPPPRREGYTSSPPPRGPEVGRRPLSPQAEDYLDVVLPRLENEQFLIVWGENGFDYVAERSRFEMTKFGFVDYTIVFAEFERLDSRSLWDFSRTAFDYAARRNGMSMPGLQGAKICLPVAMIGADEGAVIAVQEIAAPKHLAKMEFPCVIDMRAGQLHYFLGTPVWGAVYFAGLRELAARLLAPQRRVKAITSLVQGDGNEFGIQP